jgi:hypothetical protein
MALVNLHGKAIVVPGYVLSFEEEGDTALVVYYSGQGSSTIRYTFKNKSQRDAFYTALAAAFPA